MSYVQQDNVSLICGVLQRFEYKISFAKKLHKIYFWWILVVSTTHDPRIWTRSIFNSRSFSINGSSLVPPLYHHNILKSEKNGIFMCGLSKVTTSKNQVFPFFHIPHILDKLPIVCLHSFSHGYQSAYHLHCGHSGIIWFIFNKMKHSSYNLKLESTQTSKFKGVLERSSEGLQTVLKDFTKGPLRVYKRSSKGPPRFHQWSSKIPPMVLQNSTNGPLGRLDSSERS